jgi:2-polyprenyl-3-methyl-5-hydroxy-6-metoxy-1,4-benzoquinol methylase
MRHVVVAILALVSSPLAPARAGTPASPPAPGAHDPANPPIDCPLHRKGVSADTLRPFAETEKYIEFLERPDRARWQRPEAVVAALHLTGAETVADVGAGSGYFTFRFAKALPRGKVIAIDIDPEMVRHVHHKVLSEGISNVEVVLSDAADPAVSAAADVVFLCDVVHHVAGREAWLRRLFSEMRPGARLVVVEFKEGRLPQGPPEAVKIPRAQLTALLRGAGFVLEADDPKLLPYQTFLVLEKPVQPGAAR